ncbi:hypothetical protein [Puia dinghuensis]|uniref:DUF4384 domain-containing protein n=1 Tax=Puia dinghuensis TaxID=1792502 RepID=A0A8J2XSR7_9BACT|nr:hypothetical protein [Puia dinghuensis]GGA97266.1 hypothetical protein GCM10011511_20760 [Puia dinghuensis]
MRKLIPLLVSVLACSLVARPQSSQEAISMSNAIQEASRLTNPADAASYNRTGSFVSWHGGDKDSTRGSRLLFYNWPKGYVIGIYDTVLRDDRLFLNYDKISHVLYFTVDGKTIIKVQTTQARELHFVDSGKQTVLVRIDGIDPKIFFERLSDSSGNYHYTLYREIKTQYRRANYETNGLTSTGNNYDEYVDTYEYYIVMPGDRLYTHVRLKKKDIRQALGPKADAWLAVHSSDPINEAFLIGLVNQLNK